MEFSCRGTAVGYDVQLSTKSVHFGEVQIENTTNRVLNVLNDSDLPTTFQFITDKNNLFAFSQTEGVVKAHSATRVIVCFSP